MSDNGADSFSVVDEAMLNQDKLPGDRGSNWQPGTGWAYASVTPWRLYKISQHGGGITTGAIAWRGRKSIGKPGRIDASPVHMVDVMPTFLEIANLSIHPEVVGESFAALLLDKPWQRKEPLFFQYLDNRAVRSAGWTLAEVDGTGWELFNTKTDPLETRNLAKSRPKLVAAMSDRWLKWWKHESGKTSYQPESTGDSPHYKPQGDKGSGKTYTPSAMPARLTDRYPLTQ